MKSKVYEEHLKKLHVELERRGKSSFSTAASTTGPVSNASWGSARRVKHFLSVARDLTTSGARG